MQGHSLPPNPLAALLMGVTGRGVGGAKDKRQGHEVDLRSRVAGMLDKERS